MDEGAPETLSGESVAVSKEQPQSPAPPMLETEFVRDALERLCEGLGTREPFLLVTGEAGTGKTTLVRAAIERWGERATVAWVADPAMSRAELLEEIVRRFGAAPPAGASKPQLLASLEQAIAAAKSENRVPVVVIDDAHEIPAELLGELRLLGNVSEQAGGPLEIVLAGLPALEARLDDPKLAALRQRVAVQIVTEPLSSHQTRRFVVEVVAAGEKDPQSLFPKKTCRELHAYSGGVPRTLGTLADEALRLARKAGEAQVSLARVAEAAETLGLEAPAPSAPRDAAPAVAPEAGERLKAAAVSERRGTESGEAKQGGAAASTSKPAAGEPASRRAPESPVAAGAKEAAEAAPRPERRVADMPHGARAADGDPMEELKPPGDPKKVSEWVGKFISPEEPRFGDLIGTGQLAVFADADSGFGLEAEAMSDEMLARIRKRRGRVLPRYRRGRRRSPEWLGTVALVLVIIAALVTIAGPTKRMVVAGMNAMSAAAEQSAKERAEKQAAEVAEEETARQAQAEADGKKASEEATKQEAAPPMRTAQAQESRPAARPKAAAPEPYAPSAARSAPAPTPAPASTTAPASMTAQTDPNQLWALDVGTFADVGDAGLDRDRIVEATGLRGWLVRGSGGYRVVLGIYSTRERAEHGANLLLGGNLVHTATVIPLPPRSQRQ